MIELQSWTPVALNVFLRKDLERRRAEHRRNCGRHWPEHMP